MLMPKNAAIDRFAMTVLAFTFVFALLVFMFRPSELIMVLNGLFAGAMSAVVVAYGKLVWFAILGKRPYDDVRQMTLGFACGWAAICLGVAYSIYYRVTGDVQFPSSYLVALSRYLAIIAACLQVTAPDFGLGIFHGRDRKVLWAGGIIGTIVATIVIMLQGGA
jgi:hypothetical protein